MTRWILRIVGIGTLVALAAAFGPGLLRTDQITFEVAGTFGEGELLEPVSVLFVADRGVGDRIYVSDAGHNRIVVFDTNGTVLDRWEAPLYEFRRPMHLTVGSDGLIRLTEYLADRITVLTTSGELVEQIGGETGDGPGQLDAPSGVAELNGVLFVPDFYNHRVAVFGGENLTAIGRSGRILDGFLHYSTDVATDGSLVFVADAYNHRVQVFRPDGSFVRAWGGALGRGGRGGLRGWFRVATGIEVANGRVYVADFQNHRIQVFTDRGRYLGQAADSLNLPTDVSAARGGALYVADFGHNRILKLVPR